MISGRISVEFIVSVSVKWAAYGSVMNEWVAEYHYSRDSCSFSISILNSDVMNDSRVVPGVSKCLYNK